MAHHAISTAVAGLLVALAAAPAGATHPELACGHFALTEPLALPREALVLRTVSIGVNEVVLNGECVSRRARVRRRTEGGVRFVAIFRECGLARGVKVRGRSDQACSAMRGRLIARRPRFRSSFEAVAVSGHGCGSDGVCAPGSFCELPPGVCLADRLAGMCVPHPDACPDVFLPVCGCDGATYGNDCERRAAGVSKSHDGPCDTAGCFENAECPELSYCAKPPGECHAAGECQPRLVTPCLQYLQPVCGCDGNTYGNPCEARNAGVNIAHHGACEQRCGTIAGLPCPDGEVCDLEPGMCGTTDLGGVCVPKPNACPEIYAPVCGCDGVTYGNDCERVAAGAQKDRDGTCECVPILCPPDTIPIDTDHDGCPDQCLSARCETNADCPDDRWCAEFFGGGDCAAPGWCQERPLGCPDVWLPVCGCNGETYSNECDAAAAGVRVAHQGTCLCEPPICPDGQVARDGDFDGCPDRCVPVEGCLTHADCAEPNMFCGFEPGVCGTAPGECLFTLSNCPTLGDPSAGVVCGCDGRTYDDACQAGTVGVSVGHYGACGSTCGGIAGIPCPDGEVCDLEPGSCLVADAAGTCVRKPEVCPELYAPVCGCNGVTYGNDCERIAAGAQLAHPGPCTCEPPICPEGTRPRDSDDDLCDDECVPASACFNDTECVQVSPDLFCRFEDGTCGGAGRCQEIPHECPTTVDPVCGCDGVTYVNECEGSLFSLLHHGPCAPTCGTIAGLGCPDGYVCDLDAGSCFVADAGGRCVEKLSTCPDESYFPVCGCDGVTYGNDCKRIAAGVTKAHSGACKCEGICCPPWTEPYDATQDGCPDTCASTVIPCQVICDVDGCRPECPLPDACETACDCYAKFGTSFCDDCPLLCPNCGSYWQCEANRCVEACGPLPPGGIPCLAGAPTG